MEAKSLEQDKTQNKTQNKTQYKKNRMQNDSIVIMDMSGAYQRQTFYREEEAVWVDCTDVEGTNCYCDPDAERELTERIDELEVAGIHFIDSGNYHYLSGIWMKKLCRPFDLILIDHHPDMQQPGFGDILSCGGWVKKQISENAMLRRVVTIDVDQELLAEMDKEDLKRANVYQRQEIVPGLSWEKEKLPIYISLDKDVLSFQAAATGWSQGDMPLTELEQLLGILYTEYDVIGIDICGEMCQPAQTSDDRINDETNRALLTCLKSLGRERNAFSK